MRLRKRERQREREKRERAASNQHKLLDFLGKPPSLLFLFVADLFLFLLLSTPSSRRIYTLLRSPHVNKDSREQFETRTHSRLIDIKSPSADTVDKLMLLDLPAGVDVEVKL